MVIKLSIQHGSDLGNGLCPIYTTQKSERRRHTLIPEKSVSENRNWLAHILQSAKYLGVTHPLQCLTPCHYPPADTAQTPSSGWLNAELANPTGALGCLLQQAALAVGCSHWAGCSLTLLHHCQPVTTNNGLQVKNRNRTRWKEVLMSSKEMTKQWKGIFTSTAFMTVLQKRPNVAKHLKYFDAVASWQ